MILYKAHRRFILQNMKKTLLCLKPWRIILYKRQYCHQFRIKKVTLVQKIPRYDYEKCLHPDLSEHDLQKMLIARGTDLESLLARRDRHQRCVHQIKQYLRKLDVEVRVRGIMDYQAEDVAWADAVLSLGGDGTYLRASSKITSPDKPLIGVNSDPERSEGLLCAGWPHADNSSQTKVLEKFLKGEFKWKLRHRIRVKLCSQYLLSVLALNEVFIGEKDPHQSVTSYYEIKCDDHSSEKQKSSGLVIYTGTGSTSWVYNINRVGVAEVQQLLHNAQQESHDTVVRNVTDDLCNRVMEKFNQSVVFDGSEPLMAYTVREPITRGIFSAIHTQGTAEMITVKSRGWQMALFIDGWYQCSLPEGTVATFELRPCDALRTIELT